VSITVIAPALRAERLSVTLGGSEILSGVDLSLAKGRILAVLGPSGAGKSTLFRVLAGELQAQAGRVYIDERDVTREPLWARARAGLGYVPQTPSVLWDLTVSENIRTFARLCGDRATRVEAHAELVGLGDRLTVTASELSGGERRRLEILRALIAKPRLLLLDEPLSGIDPAFAGHLTELLRARAREGMAILLADHRVREALAICDEALLLAAGRVELCTTPDMFPSHPAVLGRYLG
jgi:lipopolysaccharide export system ATP-binding protein